MKTFLLIHLLVQLLHLVTKTTMNNGKKIINRNLDKKKTSPARYDYTVIPSFNILHSVRFRISYLRMVLPANTQLLQITQRFSTAFPRCLSVVLLLLFNRTLTRYASDLAALLKNGHDACGSSVCASSVFKETHRKSDPHTPKGTDSFRPFINSLWRNFFRNSGPLGRSGVSATKRSLNQHTSHSPYAITNALRCISWDWKSTA